MATAARKFEERFREAILGAGNPSEALTGEQFFSTWFRSHGRPHFFLFTKNLSVTSLQHAELLSLVKLHARDSTGERSDLQFLTIDDFFRDFNALLRALQLADAPRESLADSLIALYGNWLRALVVVELFHGSCTVFMPPHLSLDEYAVCRESGYVHSCGYNVYTRRFEELLPNDILETVKKYILADRDSEDPVRFVSVYAHEDFTEHDRRYSSELSGGLDESKVFVEKYYVGTDRFVAFLDRLREDETLHSRIFIPPPGPYKEQREAGLRHVFDENKPAWVSHTTIPHTLAGAMINITRPWWPTDRPVTVADPFSGTATVWLECHKFGNGKVKVLCSDVAPVAALLAEDNRKFFALDTQRLGRLLDELKTLSVVESQPIQPRSWGSARAREQVTRTAYEGAIELFDRLVIDEPGESIDIPAEIVEELRSRSFVDRLIFYICLRAHVRHSGGLKRRSEQWPKAFTKELLVLTWQLNELIKLREKEEQGQPRPEPSESRFIGTYSLGAGVPTSTMETGEQNLERVACHDARKPFGDGTDCVDVFITDPPYGFNTDENRAALAELYSKSIRNMVRSLRDGGQLVMAVPEESYTGRQVASFTTRAWLSQQIIAEARAAGLEAVASAQVFPRPGTIFFPPYYWESVKALGRSVLHFRFRREKRVDSERVAPPVTAAQQANGDSA